MIHGSQRKPVVAIEGLIGCGKSTFCRWIRKNTDALVANESESSLLTAFYENPKRWAFATQIDLLTQRSAMLKTAHKASLKRSIVLDRSVVGDQAFARTQWSVGNMNPDEYRLYNDVHHTLLENIEAPDVVLWLDVPIDTALERVKKRGRGEKIEYTYMIHLANSYENIVRDLDSRGVTVIKIEWKQELTNEEYSIHADKILTKMMNEGFHL